jgi:hypothetical protein
MMTIKSKRPRWEKGGKCHLFIVHCVCQKTYQQVFFLRLVPNSEGILYRGRVMVQHIRPWKIMGALQHLKTVERNPHFEDTVINEHWQKDCWADDEQLWEALTAEDTSTTEAVHVTPSTSGDNNDNTPDEVASSDDIDDEIEDRTELTGLPFDDFPWSNMLHHHTSSVFYFPFQFHFDTCC